MKRYGVRVVALLILLSLLPAFSGCGGGVIEFALVANKMYGLWKLYKVYDDGNPSWIEAAIAIWQFQSNMRYVIDYFDGNDTIIGAETGTWDVESGVLVLNVEQSTINPALDGQTVRLPGHFADQAATELSLTRQVQKGQVTVSQEQVYQKQPE